MGTFYLPPQQNRLYWVWLEVQIFMGLLHLIYTLRVMVGYSGVETHGTHLGPSIQAAPWSPRSPDHLAVGGGRQLHGCGEKWLGCRMSVGGVPGW
jgi:hypothetical protein